MHNIFTQNRLLSLVSAPIIWAAHFVVCYVIVSLACAGGTGQSAIDIGIGISTAVAFALLAYIALVNYRKWKIIRHAADREAGIAAFFAVNALLLSVLSAVALIWVAMPTIMLPPCTA